MSITLKLSKIQLRYQYYKILKVFLSTILLQVDQVVQVFKFLGIIVWVPAVEILMNLLKDEIALIKMTNTSQITIMEIKMKIMGILVKINIIMVSMIMAIMVKMETIIQITGNLANLMESIKMGKIPMEDMTRIVTLVIHLSLKNVFLQEPLVKMEDATVHLKLKFTSKEFAMNVPILAFSTTAMVVANIFVDKTQNTLNVVKNVFVRKVLVWEMMENVKFVKEVPISSMDIACHVLMEKFMTQIWKNVFVQKEL